jgi:hypothetical protein
MQKLKHRIITAYLLVFLTSVYSLIAQEPEDGANEEDLWKIRVR